MRRTFITIINFTWSYSSVEPKSGYTNAFKEKIAKSLDGGTVKCGFEHGFNIIVPAYANSTVDNTFMSAENSYRYYNKFMWNGRYAEYITLNETIKRMEDKES